MPEIRLAIPLLILRGPAPLVLAQPLMFPELSIAGESVGSATERVGRRLRQQIEKQMSPSELACRRAAPSELLRHSVQLPPNQHDGGWRSALTCTFDVAKWQPGEDLTAYYVPALQLTVLVGRRDDPQAILDAQIQAELFRRDLRSLERLASLDYLTRRPASLLHKHLTARLLTPRELQRRSESNEGSATLTLRQVATRLRRADLQRAYYCRRSLSRLAECLSPPSRRSALLVGPSGVGKTAIVHQLVRSLKRFHLQHPCWSTEGTRLVSGQCGFGMWQAQCLKLAKEAQHTGAVVHLGNLLELSEAGRIGGSGGIGSFLAGRISDGSLLSIAECTAEQLTMIQRREPKLAAAFEVIHVSPPSAEETRRILAAAAERPMISTKRSGSPAPPSQRPRNRSRRSNTAAPATAATSPAVVDRGALELLDRLHRRFPTDAAAPGRQLRFLQQLRSELAPGEPLRCQHVAAAFMRQTGLPSFLVDEQERPDLDEIERRLSSQIIGQPHSIRILVDVVATLALGFSRGDRPLASLLLIGPTGVGKTESAKALARLIYSDESRMIRIDMSELSGPSAVSRLIGDFSKPEGLLTGAIRAQPFSLLLLDEFEKAHPSVFDLLLQVLGEGRLTDSHGRVADFRNCILMMTSNLGVESFRASPMGWAASEDVTHYRHHFETEVRRFLRPEMYNRLDRIIAYDPLSPQTIQEIARTQLRRIAQRDGLTSRDAGLQWDEATVQRLSEEGYEPQLGARPLARVIERRVVTPLAEALCNLPPDCAVHAQVTTEGSHIKVHVERRDHLPRHMDPNQNPKARVEIVQRWIDMRRRVQAMMRSPAFLRVRNHRTQLRREMARMRKGAKTPQRRQQVLGGRTAAALRDHERRIQEIESLTAAVIAEETTVALAHYQSTAIDVQEHTTQLEFFRERMWEALASLLTEEQLDKQSLALFLTGPDLQPAAPLLSAYRQFAQQNEWSFDAYVLLPKDMEAPLTAEEFGGWNAAAMCALQPKPSDSPPRNGPAEPTVHVHALDKPAALTQPPRGALGCAVRVKGRGARLMMESEQGLHTFRNPDRRSREHDAVCLIETHAGRVIDFDVSSDLHKRRFSRAGYPRRQYDFDKKVVHDFLLNHIFQWDDKRTFTDLMEHLIEREADRRIWSQLD